MNLKKIKILGVVIITILSFISHFAYDIFPNIIFSFIFPVNESIWEHMKILFTSTLIYSLIEYIILKKYNITYNNLPFNSFMFILSGGIAYTIGSILYGIGHNVKWFHSVFHFFCLLGTILQAIGIIIMIM